MQVVDNISHFKYDGLDPTETKEQQKFDIKSKDFFFVSIPY